MCLFQGKLEGWLRYEIDDSGKREGQHLDGLMNVLILAPWYYVDAGIHPSSYSVTLRPRKNSLMYLHRLPLGLYHFPLAFFGFVFVHAGSHFWSDVPLLHDSVSLLFFLTQSRSRSKERRWDYSTECNVHQGPPRFHMQRAVV